jgi:hypothetical protein
MISSFVTCEYNGHQWLDIFQERQDHIYLIHNSCSLVNWILTSFSLKEMNTAGLKMIMFYFSYKHPALKQADHTKFHQNFYFKLRWNIKPLPK